MPKGPSGFSFGTLEGTGDIGLECLLSLVGNRIGSHLRVEKLLGKGGMGEVYRAFDERLQRSVALKTLSRGVAFSPSARGRFLHEARLLSQLNHPNICQIYDLLEEDGQDYLVLELIEGETLKHLLPDGVPPEKRLAVALAVTEALAAAHKVGIVHRDLKPDNIMITPEGKVKVLDLGIARTEDEEEAGGRGTFRSESEASEVLAEDPANGEQDRGDLDRTLLDGPADLRSPTDAPSLTAAGTITYMSPEQARREPVTVASDLYSLGLVLQELFTGRRAVYEKLPRREIERRVQRGETEPVEGLDPQLRELLEALKSAAPEGRPTAQETLDALQAIATAPERRRRQRFRLLASLVMIGLLLAAIAATVFTRLQDRRQAEVAQRFTQQAAELEAMLRREYLAPIHDLRPAQREVRQGMERLQDEMRGLGSFGEGPGHYALGRLALALEDFESARSEFQGAWAAGYQGDEVASGLALATFEAYRRQVPRVRALGSEEQRQKEWQRLRLDLGEPSFLFLDLEATEVETPEVKSRFAGPTDSVDYLQALRAFHAQDYDAARRWSLSASAADPLFYEAELLTAKIYRAQMEEHSLRAEGAQAAAVYQQARQALSRAAEVGRSDPGVYQETCEVDLLAAVNDLYHGSGEIFPLTLERGFAACATVLEIDPDHRQARIAMADLYLRQAEGNGESESSLEALRKARTVIEEALDLGPPSGRAWKIAGHVAMVEADWSVFKSSVAKEGVEEVAARARHAYEQAQRHAPEDASIRNALGNSHGLIGAYLLHQGEDPRASLEASIQAYRGALEVDQDYAGVYANLILSYEHLAEYLVLMGQDPAAAVEEGKRVFEACRQRGLSSSLPISSLAQLLLQEARFREDRGEDPVPSLRRARSLAEQGLELPGAGLSLTLVQAKAWLLEGRYLLDSGQDPGPSLKQVRSIAEDPDFLGNLPGWGQLLSGAAARIAAAHAMAQGKDPRAYSRKALDHLNRSLEAHEAEVEALLERGQTHLLEARILLARNQDPFASLARAAEDFGRATELRPLEPQAPLGSAQAALLSARIARRRASDPAADLAQARGFLDRVDEINPHWAKAKALRDEVDRAYP